MSPVTDDVKRGIKQLRVIEDRLLNGTLDPVAVRPALQDIIEDKSTPLSVATPHWYVSPKKQLKRVRQLNKQYGLGFKDSDMPNLPNSKTSGPTKVWLLEVELYAKDGVSGEQRTFDFHISVIRQQLEGDGNSLYLRSGLKFDGPNPTIRLHPSKTHQPGIRWVEYDYAAHLDPDNGHCVSDLWQGNDVANLAASSALSALMLFPQYGPSMGSKDTPHINLAGYQVRDGSGWSRVLYVDWWSGLRKLSVHALWADGRACDYASPVSRECSELGS